MNVGRQDPSLLRKLGHASVRAGRMTLARLALDALDALLALPVGAVIFIGVLPIAIIAIVAASAVMLGVALLLLAIGDPGALTMLIPLSFLGTVVVVAFLLIRWYVRAVGRRAIELAGRAQDVAEAKLLGGLEDLDGGTGYVVLSTTPASPSPSLAELDARLAAPPSPAPRA